MFSTWYQRFTYNQAFIEREHVNDDTIGLHLNDEPGLDMQYIYDDFHDYASWQLSGSTGFDPILTSVDNSSNVNLSFTFKVGRGGTNVQAKKDSVIYSCPQRSLISFPIITFVFSRFTL